MMTIFTVDDMTLGITSEILLIRVYVYISYMGNAEISLMNNTIYIYTEDSYLWSIFDYFCIYT